MRSPSERPIVFVVHDDALVRDAIGVRRAEARAVADLRRRFAALTAREQGIMRQVVSGRLNKLIASDLNLSEARVRRFAARSGARQAESLPDLVRIAGQLGIATSRSAPRPK